MQTLIFEVEKSEVKEYVNNNSKSKVVSEMYKLIKELWVAKSKLEELESDIKELYQRSKKK